MACLARRRFWLDGWCGGRGARQGEAVEQAPEHTPDEAQEATWPGGVSRVRRGGRMLSRARFRRLLRRVAVVGGIVVVGLIVLWIAIHRVNWLGPALADGVRAVVGPAPVAWVENVAYGWQDRMNRWVHGGDKPQSYWQVSADTASRAGAAPSGEAAKAAAGAAKGVGTTYVGALGKAGAGAERTPKGRAGVDATGEQALMPTGVFFPPSAFTPPSSRVAAAGDGSWMPMEGRFPQGMRGQDAPFYKAIVHPDAERPYTILAVVALDLTRVRVHAAAGTKEPVDASFPLELRSGLIAPEHWPSLVAAFNGGFQTIHGGYGMMVNGHRIGEPMSDACTVCIYGDGGIRIRSWDAVSEQVGKMVAYRQTPRCLVEQGVRHPDLKNRYNTSWGAVVNGATVVRRSALGIDRTGKVLFFGMGDALTARSLADGMMAAGAHDVAQLDVNHAFPRFVLFGDVDGQVRATTPLCPGFSFSPDDYVESPKKRDFFFVTVK